MPHPVYTAVRPIKTDLGKVALQTKVADMRRLSELPDELRMRWRHVRHHQVEKFVFICKKTTQTP